MAAKKFIEECAKEGVFRDFTDAQLKTACFSSSDFLTGHLAQITYRARQLCQR